MATLLCVDIESNPTSNYKIHKSVSGSFHQGNEKFKETAGIQCSCNALYAICYSIIKKISLWKTWDLDYILNHGDETFKAMNILRTLFIYELPKSISIENKNIDVELLANYNGYLGQVKIFENHSTTDIGNGIIFTTGGYSFSIIWSKKNIFLFDSHSRDINGHFTENGNSVTLSFPSLNEVEKYVKAEYSRQFSNFFETQFEVQYIRVTTSLANVAAILDSIKNYKNRVNGETYHQKILGTSKHDEINSLKCKKRAEIFGTPMSKPKKRNVARKT